MLFSRFLGAINQADFAGWAPYIFCRFAAFQAASSA